VRKQADSSVSFGLARFTPEDMVSGMGGVPFSDGGRAMLTPVSRLAVGKLTANWL